ncbi:MAG: hypothetical protein IK079_03440, partial [Desulfovibrio sp.]|nr:hypothetical protein [Desulfovibrio sp.]
MYKYDVIRKFGLRGKGYSSPDNYIIKNIKAIHLLSATAWAGGALAMQALSFLKFSTADVELLPTIQYCLYFVDTWVVMPGLFGCILTGLFYSLVTSIGFFKYAWVGFKWIVALSACFWGLLFWFPYGDMLIEHLAKDGWDWPLRMVRSFILPESMWQGGMQLLIILTMCLVSVYRPLSFRKKYKPVRRVLEKEAKAKMVETVPLPRLTQVVTPREGVVHKQVQADWYLPRKISTVLERTSPPDRQEL